MFCTTCCLFTFLAVAAAHTVCNNSVIPVLVDAEGFEATVNETKAVNSLTDGDVQYWLIYEHEVNGDVELSLHYFTNDGNLTAFVRRRTLNICTFYSYLPEGCQGCEIGAYKDDTYGTQNQVSTGPDDAARIFRLFSKRSLLMSVDMFRTQKCDAVGGRTAQNVRPGLLARFHEQAFVSECAREGCDDLPAPDGMRRTLPRQGRTNFVFSHEIFLNGTTFDFICNNGLEFSVSSTCLRNQLWSNIPTNMTCEGCHAVGLRDVEVDYESAKKLDSLTYAVGSAISMTCTMVNRTFNATCLDHKSWSIALQSADCTGCNNVETGDHVTLDESEATVTPSANYKSYAVGSTISLECALRGPVYSSRCQQNFTWSPEVPNLDCSHCQPPTNTSFATVGEVTGELINGTYGAEARGVYTCRKFDHLVSHYIHCVGSSWQPVDGELDCYGCIVPTSIDVYSRVRSKTNPWKGKFYPPRAEAELFYKGSTCEAKVACVLGEWSVKAKPICEGVSAALQPAIVLSSFLIAGQLGLLVMLVRACAADSKIRALDSVKVKQYRDSLAAQRWSKTSLIDYQKNAAEKKGTRLRNN